MKKILILFFAVFLIGCSEPQDSGGSFYNFPSSDQDFLNNYELKQVNAIRFEASNLRQQKRFDEAIEKLQEGIFAFSEQELKEDLKKELYITYSEKALHLSRQGQYIKAIPALRLAIENCYECSNNRYSTLYGSLAMWLDKVGRTDEAIEAIKTAISYSPDDIRPYTAFSQFLDAEGRQPEAIQVLEKAVKIEPEDANTYWRLGSLYSKQGDYSKAIQVLNKSIQIEPKNFYSNFVLSLAYKEAGMQKEYEEFLKRAYDIDPNTTTKLLKSIE